LGGRIAAIAVDLELLSDKLKRIRPKKLRLSLETRNNWTEFSLDGLPPEIRLSMRWLRVIVVAIFLGHAVVGFLFYRWRVVSQSSLSGSDWIVFGIPFWVAFAAYWAVFTVSRISGRDQCIAMSDSRFCLSLARRSAGSSTCFSLRILMGPSTPCHLTNRCSQPRAGILKS